MTAITASAQDDATPVEKYKVVTGGFWQNWFFSTGITGTAFYSDAEHGLGLSKNPFKAFRSNVGFSFSLGKWFTPSMGLRTRFGGVWGREVVSIYKNTNATRYWTIDEQLLFNISNMWFGYDDERLYNLIPYFGFGVQRNIRADAYASGISAGFLNTLRLNDRVKVNIELGYAYHEHNNQSIALEFGITYGLGKRTWDRVPDIDGIHELSQREIDALSARLYDALKENERLREGLKKAGKE